MGIFSDVLLTVDYDRTLTDADSEAVVNKVLAALKEKLDATLR